MPPWQVIFGTKLQVKLLVLDFWDPADCPKPSHHHLRKSLIYEHTQLKAVLRLVLKIRITKDKVLLIKCKIVAYSM